MHSYSTEFLWGPITCAVWNGNESTFNALVGILSVKEIVGFRDSRGWTLLHFAAQNGCGYTMSRLMDLGSDTEALTMGTRYWVMEKLDYRSLKAETIAMEYGHGEVWDGIIAQKKIDMNENSG